jgi:hypothetical protein
MRSDNVSKFLAASELEVDMRTLPLGAELTISYLVLLQPLL